MISACKRVLVFIALPVVFGHAGCALFHSALRPAEFGGELADCELQAGDAGWAKATPCCVDVAKKYDRDPAFCFPTDGGQ